ncbi:hypothetical protein SESBI_21793 [Sesbania bispinosa]|nr:hypothetical protein SESBI_21793 [Sesbania bispinosa]
MPELCVEQQQVEDGTIMPHLVEGRDDVGEKGVRLNKEAVVKGWATHYKKEGV